MPVKSQKAARPVVGACQITRCRTYLDETLNNLQPNQHEKSCLSLVRPQDASELVLVAYMPSAVDKRGRRTCCKQTYKQTYIQTNHTHIERK